MYHPVYIVNLPQRTDRREHILSQFEDRTEFVIHIKEPVKHAVAAVSLWLTLRDIVKEEKEKGTSYFILCEDDHTFTNAYSTEMLEKCILRANSLQADILSGGIGGFGNAYPLGTKRYWIDWLRCTQFIVVYRPFFQRILDEPFTNTDTVDEKISEMTGNKAVIHPFISIQHDFGFEHVDVNQESNEKITEYFHEADKRLGIISGMLRYHNEILD